MKEYDKAMETYQEGLKHDENNQELLEGVQICIEKIKKTWRKGMRGLDIFTNDEQTTTTGQPFNSDKEEKQNSALFFPVLSDWSQMHTTS